MFKGWKTVIFNLLVVITSAGDLTSIINVTDSNTAALIALVVGLANVVLRFGTDTKIFSKE